MTMSLGFDPEYFVKTTTPRGYGDSPTAIPICGLLGGTKEKGISFDNASDYQYHEDGVVAEITMPYADNPEQAARILEKAVGLLMELLYTKSLRILPRGQYQFSNDDLQHPNASMFGCSPDICAYSGGIQNRIDRPDFGDWRFAGGHIHIGGDFNCPLFVVALFCDLIIGTDSRTGGARYGSATNERVRWYGAAGTYREKPYGIEYRTLDSRWTLNRGQRQRTCNNIAYLVNWLESTSSRNIKKVCDEVDWLSIRAYIQEPKTAENNQKVLDVRRDALERMGLLGVVVV